VIHSFERASLPRLLRKRLQQRRKHAITVLSPAMGDLRWVIT
jgi:hypothetical protein